MQRSFDTICVEQRIQVADIFSQRLIDAGEQTSPERGYGAGASDYRLLAIHQNVVAGFGIGVAGDVWNAAAYETVRSFRDARGLLITR